jgi:intracellular sulfur oxidation DsrE/DsrF family protein
MADVEDAAPAPRKGPGRPKKKQPKATLEMNGIVDNPFTAGSLVELMTDNSMDLKSFTDHLKKIGCHEVTVRFSRTSATFFTSCHSDNSKIVGCIDGSKVNWYYCSEVMCRSFDAKEFIKIFAAIDKSICKLSIIIRSGNKDQAEFILKNSENDSEAKYNLTLKHEETEIPETYLNADHIANDPSVLGVEFPIEFTLKGKTFKKLIQDSAQEGNKVAMHFVRYEDQPLQVQTCESGEVKHEEIYYDDEKICMNSKLGKGGLMMCKVYTNNFKAFAGALLTEDVRISCSQRWMRLRISTEKSTIVIHTVTECLDDKGM